MQRACPSVRLTVCMSVCLSVAKIQKNAIFSKLSILEPWSLLTTYIGSRTWAFQRTCYWTPKIQDGGDWKLTWRHFFSAEGGQIWIKFRRLVQNDMLTAVIWLKLKKKQKSDMADVSTNSLACHPRATCHIAGCCHLANSMTCHPRATLQDMPTATRWIHCHDPRATCHIAGCQNSICYIENRFSPYFVCFLNAVWALTSGAAFVSSSIGLHLL